MPIDAWPMDAAAGAPSYSGPDLRLTTVVPFMAGAGASLGVRSGVRLSGSGTDLLVQAQASPNMSVKINPGVIVVQGSISTTQGAYTWVNDTVLTRTIAAAHASLARTDLVVVRIRDAGVDTSGGRDGDVVVITGTAGGGVPSLPTDATYFTLAQVAVGAAASSIVAGNITDKRLYTAALGAPIPCLSTVRPAGLPNQRIVEIDTGYELRWNGSKYLRDPVRVRATQTTWASNITLSAVTGMTIPLDANSVYEWDLFASVFGFQNIGVSLALQIPASATLDAQVQGWQDSSGAQFTANIVAATGNAALSPASVGWGYNGSTNQSSTIGKGSITTGATAGNAVLLGAQRVSNASLSRVDAPTWMEVRQVV